MFTQDFNRPGHMFPLRAREGGVLVRPGHTEAAVDLCRLAGRPLVAAICEICNPYVTLKKMVWYFEDDGVVL